MVSVFAKKHLNDIRQLKAQELKREPDFVHDEDPDSAKLHETIKNKKGDRERKNREKEREIMCERESV
jgi:hypothetical protein